MAINKVVYGNTTLVDLTEDTATEEDVMEGKTFHDASGQKRTGSATQGGRVQDVEVNGESVVNAQGIAEVVVPVSGDVSTTDSFESYTGGKVKSLQMELLPIQDLHGYDHPWVGGAGKNKLDKDNYVLSYTSDNLVIIGTVNIESGKSYTFSCEQDKDLTGSTRNTLAVTYDGNTYYEMVNSNYHNEKGTHTYNFTSNYTGTATLAFWCHTPSDTSITYSKFMFQEGVYTSYEPYENKCPISAHTQAKLEQRGKNKIPFPYANTTKTTSGITFTVNPDSSITVSGTATGNADFYLIGYYGSPTEVIESGTYEASIEVSDAHRYDFQIHSGVGNSGYATIYDKSGTINANRGITYLMIRVASGKSFSTPVTIYPMIRLASDTDSTYEPYQGKDYIINLGGSYYGGTLKVVSGEFIVTKAILDLGSRTWIKSSVRHYTEIGVNNPIRPYAPNGDNTYIPTLNDGRCTDYVATSRANIENVQYGFSIHASGSSYITIRDKRYDELSGEEFKTAINGVYLCYKLATPQTIQLTPQQVEAFPGENNFSAPLEQQEIIEIVARNIAEFNEVIDDENISDKFTYSSEKIEDRLDEYVDKDAVDVKSATTEFETINGGLLSECKVTLEPVQSGSGDPSPDNVRPISGHTQVVFGDDGKNEIQFPSFADKTQNGITFKRLNASSVRILGIATGNAYLFDSVVAQFTLKHGTHIASCNLPSNQSAIMRVFGIVNGTASLLADNIKSGSSVSFNLANDTEIFAQINVPSGSNFASGFDVECQIELGSTATPYVPYNGYRITVNLGGTYYSGVLDVVSGVFVVDKVKAVTPTRGAIDSSGKLYAINFSGGIIHEYTNTNIATPYVMCSHLDVDSLAGARETQRKCICQYARTAYIGGYIGKETELDNMLASADFSIVFELATPLTIQLTPQQVQALVGENNLFAPLNGQEIGEVKYKEAFDFNDVMKIANYFTLPLQTFTFTNKVCNVNDSRVTSNSLVDVYFTSDSMSSVEDAGITVESQNGKIVMTAEEQPVGTIQGRIKVVN